MTVTELIKTVYFYAELSGVVKNKKEFASMVGCAQQTISRVFSNDASAATPSLANKVRAAFPDIAAQVEGKNQQLTEVHFGDINNQSPHHFTTGADARVHELEVENAALKAENAHLRERLKDKDEIISMLKERR